MPTPRPKTILILYLFLSLLPTASRADISLPSLFSDNMILQQHQPIHVWGKADPGESVTVQLGPDSAQALAAKDGSWSVKLDALPSGGPYDMTVSGKNSLVVQNVAIGEVWLCSGESNMEYKVIAARNGPGEMADADLPMVRVFTVQHAVSESPAPDCQGAWVVSAPDTAKDFSAIGFFFARELNRHMRVPIGIIQSAWGPSTIEAWTPRDRLEKDPTLRQALDQYDNAAAAYPSEMQDYDAQMTAWKASAATSPRPPMPVEPLPPGGPREPSALYDAMIYPLTRFPIRGALWYQGESNTLEPDLYAKLLPAMIGAWRAAWSEGDFPFFYAQLSGFLQRRDQPGDSQWAQLRDAQAAALRMPKTAMVVTADTAEPNEMHPADKQDVAHRFALLAENSVYGDSTAATSGPVFSGMQIAGAKAIISFSHTGGGLVAKNGPLNGFAIAGPDGRFVWADAQIEGDKVIVHSDDTPQPAAVRYGWADFPDCNLFNTDGLPAAPFRTDGAPEIAAAAPDATPAPPPRKRRRHHLATQE